ncbi:MAG: hypothetical protein KAX44_08100, partial [Candidatus Brocadiae bacterium]|nr:hypothetical protein [Candidatus Brocadiia bacterium]
WPPTGSEFVLHPPSSISGPWVGPGRFANQPLLLFVQRQRPGAKVAARLTLAADRGGRTEEWNCQVPDRPTVAGPFVRQLVSELQEKSWLR